MMVRWLLNRYGGAALQNAATAWNQETRRRHEERQRTPCSAVLVFATAAEAAGVADRLEKRLETHTPRFRQHDGWWGKRRVVVAECGEGVSAAATATQDLIALHRPGSVIAAGFATALEKEVRRGEMILANELVDAYGNRLGLPIRFEPSHGVRLGRLLTLDEPLKTVEAKRQANDAHAALAYDCETIAVAQCCRAEQVPMFTVRVIHEGLLEAPSPAWAAVSQQAHWGGRLGAAAGALWRKPDLAQQWWKMKHDATRRSDRLADFLAPLIAALT